MTDFIFVSGNANKVRYFAKLANLEVKHHEIKAHEIQSLDLDEVVRAKAEAAYQELGQPVIVEDTALTITSMGKLPGTFIKWFIEEIGLEKICRLADMTPERAAIARSAYAVYDGHDFVCFKGELIGTIAQNPAGSTGFGWNALFIPDGTTLTLGEMDEEQFTEHYLKIKAIREVGDYIRNLQQL